MFDLFSNINVDWMGIRRPLIAVSIFVLLAGLGSAVGRQFSPGGSDAFNLGVDFQGGTVITAKFKDGKPPEDEIRAALKTVGFSDAVIQESTDKTDEVLIKVPLIEGEAGALTPSLDDNGQNSNANTVTGKEVDANASNPETNANSGSNTNLESDANSKSNSDVASNVNTKSNANSESNANSGSNTNSVSNTNSAANTQAKKEEKKCKDDNQICLGRELVKKALNTFGTEAPPAIPLDQAEGAKYKIVGTDSVGPIAGEKLRNQAVLATLLGMVGILLFIAFRYDWTYAAGAVIAVFHDA